MATKRKKSRQAVGRVIRYVPYIPKKVRAGQVLVHNPVQALTADHPPGMNGFRAWLNTTGDKGLVICRCGWATGLKHYRVRGTRPSPVNSAAVKRLRKRLFGEP
jgi:hypothetical protein